MAVTAVESRDDDQVPRSCFHARFASEEGQPAYLPSPDSEEDALDLLDMVNLGSLNRAVPVALLVAVVDLTWVGDDDDRVETYMAPGADMSFPICGSIPRSPLIPQSARSRRCK